MRLTRAAGELVLFFLVAISPWPFASNEPPFEAALSAGVLLLTALWAVHATLVGRLTLRPDLVSVCLAAIAVWTAIQLVPLPESIIGAISPARLEWHRALLPDQDEVLPGEADPVPRPTSLPLTVAPAVTRTFLVRVLGVLLVYAAARNWLATRHSIRRLAWVLAVNGTVLAVLALSQLFTAPAQTVYWTIRTDGGAFGPFVCRNHYPDYVVVCAGLALGLLLADLRTAADGRDGATFTAQAVGLAGAVGLMLVSIAFSLSRGGVLSAAVAAVGTWLLARVMRRGGSGPGGRVAVAAVVVFAAVAAGWFGTDLIEQRLATFATGEAAASRLPIWRDVVRLVPRFWATGTGGGTFVWAEPTVRTTRPAMEVVDSAHNEYLEAWVEGGLPRVGLTVVMAVGLLVVVGRGFVRRRDRSVGPLLLGSWFGLAAVVVHAAGDFGTHMPAVALLTAAVAGFAAAAATDPAFVPERYRVHRTRGGGAQPPPPPPPPRVDEGWPTVRGPVAVVLALAVGGLALFVALDARDRERGYRLKLAADVAYWDPESADRLADRAAYLDARAAGAPDDSVALADAAQGHIDEAVEATWVPAAALTGVGAGYTTTPDRMPDAVVRQHIYPALRLLRAARAADPIAPRPHTRLALYAGYFARSEPPAVHFARAKRLLPADPDVWFASGKEAYRRRDLATAWDDWRRSLAVSTRHLGPILRAARADLTPADMAAHLLPDDPVVLLAAVEQLFPDHEAGAAERRPYLEAVVARVAARTDPSPEELVAAATAYDGLGRRDEAWQAWRRAVDAGPNRTDVRDAYARWLELEEEYEEVIPHLEWLGQQSHGDPVIRDRLDAAQHGLKLKHLITSP